MRLGSLPRNEERRCVFVLRTASTAESWIVWNRIGPSLPHSNAKAGPKRIESSTLEAAAARGETRKGFIDQRAL